MPSKTEAKRFSGKPGTWAHCEMAVRAHFAIVGLIEHLTDGAGIEGGKRAEWRKAQLKNCSHFILTCDDRAAATLLSIDTSKEAVGWITFQIDP